MPPNKNGLEILEIIRQKKEFADIPVIFLTSELSHEIEAEALRKGASDYICKPLDAEILRSRIDLNLQKITESKTALWKF
jgi:DNA-binding response OmpR family regulator